MKKIEIGSEFHINSGAHTSLKNDIDNIFSYLRSYNMIFYDSGRSALRSLLENIDSGRVLLPDYICESVRNCFPKSMVTYYHIDKELHIDWDDLIEKCKSGIDILYLHYFNGYIGKEYDFKRLIDLKKERNFTIIEDTTHSFLSLKHTVGDYCICSLRKWFPVPDGGVLYSEKTLNLKKYTANSWHEIKRTAMENKGLYLQGRKVQKEEFLSTFVATEELLDLQTEPFAISEKSYETLKYIDINKISEVRCKNYSVLTESIKEIKQVAMGGMGQVPLFYTVSIKDRDLLRKYLIANHIYCPVHWPLYDELEKRENSVYNNARELSIPIDQRYDNTDMEYIITVIAKYFKEYYGSYEEN